MHTGNTVGIWNGARREMEDEGWKLARTLRGGSKAMREAGEIYTPILDIEKRERSRYEDRLKSSVLFPAYDDRVRSLASLPFQKEPTIDGDLPEPLDRIIGDADRCGTSLAAFAQVIYQDAIDRGMGMFLVDTVPTDGMTLPEADAVDARPYFARVAPDNLVGYATDTRNGRDIVTELRYREWIWRPNKDGVDTLVDRVRVWDEATVHVWERSTGEQSIDREAKAAQQQMAGYELVETINHGFPGGVPLVIVYTDKVATAQAKPALLSLAWLNVAHWESTSLQRAATKTGRFPILKIGRASNEFAETRPKLGPGATALDTSDLDMTYVEIAGSSLAAGEVEIDKLERQMEALGMRPMMAAQGPETATGEVRSDMAEKSQAQSWVEALEWALYQGFAKAAQWIGQQLADDFDLTLFKDSSLIAGKATDMMILQGMRSARDLSRRSYLSECKARGVLVTVDDIDEELERIKAEADEGFESMADRFIQQRGEGDEDDEDTPIPGEPDPEPDAEDDGDE